MQSVRCSGPTFKYAKDTANYNVLCKMYKGTLRKTYSIYILKCIEIGYLKVSLFRQLILNAMPLRID